MPLSGIRDGVPGRLPEAPGVRLLGLTGAPGVGKSTLAAALASRWAATVVPMDGFHLPDAVLRRRGLLDRKGAPDTFDAEGYAVLLGRVGRGEPHVSAPSFDHGVGQAVAGAIAVPADGLVLTEGNYLLLDEPRWRAVRDRIDVVWHLRSADDVRRERLVARHVAAGRTLADARAWVAAVDEPNARLVEAAAGRADRVIELPA